MIINKLKKSINDNWSDTTIKEMCFGILESLIELEDKDKLIKYSDLIDMTKGEGFTHSHFVATLAILSQSKYAILNSVLIYQNKEGIVVLDDKQTLDLMSKDAFIHNNKPVFSARTKCSPAFYLSAEAKKDMKRL